MTEFTLRLRNPSDLDGFKTSEFYWTQDPCSFQSSVGPNLGHLGRVERVNIDFARIAAAVFAADRSVLRKGGGSDWNQRDIGIRVPVSDVQVWNAVTDELVALLGFLTGDNWTLRFYRASAPREEIARRREQVQRVVLLSGGADSAVGALVSRAQLDEDQGHVLVSHVGATYLSPFQKAVAERIETLIPGPKQIHHQVALNRMRNQPNGLAFANESSSRSRSVLFLALGLAVASVYQVPLWMPENGFASLNPPLGPDRRGSLSTHTTHPALLSGLRRVLSAVGAHAEIENPFAYETKGDLFKRAVELVGPEEASDLLSSTHSCGLAGQRAFGLSPGAQCGVCFGCVVRRAAFLASGLVDKTSYVGHGDNQRLDAWLSDKSVEPSVRVLARRGIESRDIASLSLPPEYPTSVAIDLCRRGLIELGGAAGASSRP